MALQGQPVLAYAHGPTIPCKEANEALIFGIVGLFCFGIILGPVAIVKANQAKRVLALNPNMTGSGKATAGLILGVLALLGGIVNVYFLVNRHH